MDITSKYLKYKNKYNNLKGGERESFGINYEGNQIIRHVLQYQSCVGYANIQIAMDAPYEGRVADERLRERGRSEQQFNPNWGYNEERLINHIYLIFLYIKEKYLTKIPNIKLVLQIARGKAAPLMYTQVLENIFRNLGILDNFENFIKDGVQIKYKSGYRKADYYVPTDESPFVFVNIGMFAVLTNIDSIPVGMICNVTKTKILQGDIIANGTVKNLSMNEEFIIDKQIDKEKNILSMMDIFKPITILSLPDEMPFLTPDKYSEYEIKKFLI